MSINTLSAVNAYRSQLKMQQGIEDSLGGEEASGKPSFGDLMKDALTSAVDTQYKSEDLKMESLTGRVELSDLVTSVANAELTLNTVVAVRDRVISAYQDIIRMPI